MKSPSPVKARKAEAMSRSIETGEVYKGSSSRPDIFEPVAVLSLSPAASEARIEAGAKAIFWLTERRYYNCGVEHAWKKLSRLSRMFYALQARAVLSAWGLLASAKEKGKK